jgi:hypothetical protein
VHTRFLTVLAVSAFVLTLLFAVAAGAQDGSTEVTALSGGNDKAGGAQVQQAQQQVGPAAAPSPPRGPLAGAKVLVSGSDAGDTIENGDTLRINGDYQVEEGASITIEDADGTQGTFVDGRNADITETEDGIRIEVTGKPIGVAETGTNTNKTLSEKGRVEAVASDGVRVSGSGSGGNNGGGGTDGNTTDSGVTPTQANTPDGTTTDGTTTDGTTTGTGTSDPTAELTTADNASGSANRDGSFRCDSFLRVVRDENGALRRQYNGDEMVVQRFEQCLEGDVLANTIPNRLLPDTGGPSLPVGGGALLLVTGVGLALRVIRR